MSEDTGEGEQAAGGMAESWQSTKASLLEAKNAVNSFFDGISQWVERRARINQLLIAAAISWAFRDIVSLSSTGWHTLQSSVPTFTTPQLLVGVIGILLTQTAMQAQKLNQLEYVEASENMASKPRTDGGPPRDSEGRFKEKNGGSSGGGAIGGAIAGGALGASFGPGGAAFGAIMGAILGDEIEKGGKD